MKQSKIFMLLFSILILLVGCGANQEAEPTLLETPYERKEFLMGTYVVLRVYDEGKEAALDEAVTRIEVLEEKITSNAAGSEIDEINQAAGESAVEVSADIFPLIEQAAEYSALPNGGFDYTVGPIVNLWRIGFDDARVPTQNEIDAALLLVAHEKVELDAEAASVYLTEPGMNIDLGAIAKGYIADEVMEVFDEQGVTTAIVDLGGNVVVRGDSPTREEGGWNVGIQDPFLTRGEIVGFIHLTDTSIVTSGIYERYLEENGETYHHLLNPETGYPFDNELAGVTIISEFSIDGDALSTAVFSFGLEKGLEFVNEQEDIEAVFITKDKELYTSDGLKDTFELTNAGFTWTNE